MSRWRAALIHSSISALVGVTIGVLLIGVWFPPPFFHATGADRLTAPIGLCVALGPLLTLVVFRTGKWGLKFDLVVIGVLQISALAYCLWTALQTRPVFLVGAVDRFVLVSANEVADADLESAVEPQFRSRSWTGPRLVAAELPTDPTERSDLAFSALSGRDVQNLPKYYRDYARSGAALLAKAKPLAELRTQKSESAQLITNWLIESGRSEASVVWLPLQTRKTDLVMLLDGTSAEPLHSLAIDPW